MKPIATSWASTLVLLFAVETCARPSPHLQDSLHNNHHHHHHHQRQASSKALAKTPQPQLHQHHHRPYVRPQAQFQSQSTSRTKMTVRTPGLRSVMYFTNWSIYGRNFQPQDLEPLADSYTHILYSFANVKADTGEVVLTDPWSDTDKHYPTDSWNDSGTNVYGCIKQLFLLKKKYRNLKVLLSVGGWTYSPNFAAPMSTASGRQRFVDSAIQLLEDLGFDGIDVDWEYPATKQQGEHFVELLRCLRAGLDAAQARREGGDTHFLATVAVAAGPTNYQNYNVAEMNKYLDFWNLMAYDYAGSWDRSAGHQANIHQDHGNMASTPFNSRDALNYYISNGVPSNKLILGMPLYGRTFCGTGGPGKPYSGCGEGSWENGIWDYKVLPKAGAKEVNDPKVGASWSYDGNKQEMITYDTPTMVKTKARYVQSKALGGGMWWEASGDKPRGQGSLVETFVDAVGGCDALERRHNCLSYNSSKYANMREGFPNN